jgi:hypothetical protein
MTPLGRKPGLNDLKWPRFEIPREGTFISIRKDLQELFLKAEKNLPMSKIIPEQGT